MVKITHRDVSPEALTWFESCCEQVKKDTQIEVLIYTTDFRKNSRSLGYCRGYKQGEGLEPLYIVIDSLHVQTRYDAEVKGKDYDVTNTPLKFLLCHELAHIKYRRHGKKHSKHTQWLIDLCS